VENRIAPLVYVVKMADDRDSKSRDVDRESIRLPGIDYQHDIYLVMLFKS